MFTLLCNHEIFPRPTPWFVAWQAAWAYISGKQTYRFVYLPAGCRIAASDEIILNGDTFILRHQDYVVSQTITETMSWQHWLLYLIESWAFGPLLRFWNWRWKRGGVAITTDS